MPALGSDRDERRLREQAKQALGRVGAADLADSMPGTLAYGLRKRVALARALVGHPRLLLFDALLCAIAAQAGASLVIVNRDPTHYDTTATAVIRDDRRHVSRLSPGRRTGPVQRPALRHLG